MIPEDDRRLLADALHEPILLVRLDCDALELVVGHLADQHRPVEVIRRKPFLQRGDGYAGRRMGVHHAMRVGERAVDRRMDHESSTVHRPLRFAHGVAFGVDEHEVGGLTSR